MRQAYRRVTPVRRPKNKKKYPSRTIERVKGDKNFERGWGFSHDTSNVAHYFTPSAGGMRVTLCHSLIQAPVWIAVSVSEQDRRCRSCEKLLQRRTQILQARKEAELKRKVDGRVARFLADPLLGPRLYACPVCHSVYEGMAPNLFPCTEGGHEAAMVVELARKDTWTRDKP